MENNQNEVIKIAGTHLGKVGGEGYKDTYDPGLLVAIPRHFNRESYGIKEGDLPFVGGDVWNAYEVSGLTEKGLPVSGMMKIYYSCDSPLHVESKSIKLYLNSFNMTKLGQSAKECKELIEGMVGKDLSEALHTDVKVKFFLNDLSPEIGFGEDYPKIQQLVNLDEVEFTAYKSDEKQLVGSGKPGILKVEIDFLRSNCRVTNQPDFGNMFVYIEGNNLPTLESLAKYIVSHRQVSHFHEEIVEMSFVHLQKAFDPKKLMVASLYTRRGGIDINPIRATHADLIPGMFIDVNCRNKKTMRQ